MTIDLRLGDCLDVMSEMDDASVDAVVTDPPAGISFMGKAFDHHRGGRLQWVAWLSERLAEARRVAKPGAYMLCWALPRTSHWTGCAIEDAGWVISDRIAHAFGQGFPKHKSKLKPAVEDWWLAWNPDVKATPLPGLDACRVEGAPPSREQPAFNSPTGLIYGFQTGKGRNGEMSGAPGRWPPNLLLSHSPGCVHVGTKRVKGSHQNGKPWVRNSKNGYSGGWAESHECEGHTDPDGLETVADWQCDEGCPVRLMGEQSGDRPSGIAVELNAKTGNGYSGGWQRLPRVSGYTDSGTAARFFPQFAPDPDPFLYAPKASRRDRGDGNTHPTVKSQQLMRWLVRLVTPPGGVILDPFAGSGSTLLAAEAEGFDSIGIEESFEYAVIARGRIGASAPIVTAKEALRGR